MKVTYQGLSIVLPIDGIVQVEDFTLEASFNRHASVSLLLLIEEEGIEGELHGLTDGAAIEVYEDEVLFKGKIQSAEVFQVKGLYYLNVKALSYTNEWELAAVSQTYLNLDATYEQVMKKVLEDHPQSEIKDCITGGRTIPDFLLQYEETDWDFLIRLASHFQSFVIPDYKEGHGRAYFGIPDLGEETVLSEEDYETVKDLENYMQVNLDGQLMQQEAIRWHVKTYHSFVLAQKVAFRGISTVVTRIKYQTVDGELCRFYELSRKKGYLSVPQKNKNIFGMSIPATVKARSGNCVRVHFHIDKEYDASPNVRYFTFAIESSFIYCMPEVGSQVHIYFPSEDESDAIAVHAIRMSGDKGAGKKKSTGVGYAENPDYKSFSNVNAAELLLTPTTASAAAEEAKDTCVHLDTDGNVSITGKNIDLYATTDLNMGDITQEDGTVTKEISMKGEKVTVHVGKGSTPQVELGAEAKIKAAFVKLNASDTSTASPSPAAIAGSMAEGDKNLRENVNQATSQNLVNKYEAGRRKIIDGASRTLGAVATVALAIGMAPFTGGASLGVGTIALFGLTAAGTVVSGTADFMEGIEDVNKSRKGDLSESENFVRDTVFEGLFGENKQAAYEIAKLVNDITFGVVSGKVIGTMGGKLLDKSSLKITCNSPQLRNLKTALQVGSGIKNTMISDLATTGKIDVMNAVKSTVVGIVQGQLGGRMTDGILDMAGAQKWGKSAAKVAKVVVGTGVDTGLDAAGSGILNKEFDLKQSLLTNGFTNGLLAGIADPVDAASGFYLIHATDFILASLPSALKLERTYSSGNRDTALFGRGWAFPLGSRIYRDHGERGIRLHLTTITGHMVMFENEEGRWVNKTRGCQRFSLEADEDRAVFLLTDVVDHTVCVYGSDGMIQRVGYPNHQFLTFSYECGQLSGIITPLGNRLDIVCKNGKILQITDDIGRRLQYRYEGEFLTDVIHTDEGITHYEYDQEGRVLSATNENGTRYVVNAYDMSGRVICQTLADGTRQTFEYDDRYRKTIVTFGEDGRKEIYEHNDQLLVTTTTYGDGTSLSYEYSDQNLRIGQVSRNGCRTLWKYDDHGRQVWEARPDGYELHQEYDENHDLVRTWDTDRRETVQSYDKEHNLISTRERIGENQWRETLCQYDEKGRRVSTRDGLGNETSRQYEPDRAYPSRVITPKGEETAYEYDRVGRRMSIGNAYGTVHLSYNSRNFVTKRTDGEGYTSRWFYDRMGNLVSYYPAGTWEAQKAGYEYLYNQQERRIDTISPLGYHHRLFRNFDGNITREIHPVSYKERGEDGEGTRYEYDWYGNSIRITYADGGIERRFYDPDGNLVKQVMPEAYDRETDDGSGYRYSYDPMGRMTRVEDPEGNLVRSYGYNGHGQLLWEKDGEGKESFYEYNGLGLKIQERVSVRREGGRAFYRVIVYEYDDQGNKTAEAYGQEETVEGSLPKHWHRIRFSYDRNNRLIQVWDDFGAEVRYDYDCLGNLTLEEQVIEEGIRRRVRYSYNKNGWRVKREETIQGNGKTTSAVTSYEYDKNGNVTVIKTPNGFEIRRDYDADGQMTKERIIDRSNGIDRVLARAYDAAGNLVRETIEGREGEILQTEYGYDLKDRKIREQSPMGRITRYLYDQNDQLLKETGPYGPDTEGGKTAGTVYSYDSRGNRIRETNGLGQVVRERSYNTAGQPVAEKDGLGHETEFAYLPEGQIKSVSRARGSERRTLQSYQYNARGQITGIIDGVGEKVTYDVDGWGRIIGIGFSDGVKEGYEYTPSGQVSRATDGNGNSVYYQYNSLGKMRSRTDQLGNTERFEYDGEGNLKHYIDRNGNQVFRTYNVFGNVVYEKAVDKEGKNAVITTCRYDSLGRIKQAVRNGHSYEYEYNDQGLLKEKRSSGKRLVSYEYDKAGQITKLTDPSGTETVYEYDILGRASRIMNSQGLEVRYGYDCLDRVEEITYGNHVQTRYEYDGDGNVSFLETKAGEEILLSFRYEYDGNGNRVAKRGEQAAIDGKQRVTAAYCYDIRGQLTEERDGDACTSYGYDSAGNRIWKRSPERETRYVYNEKNQLISEIWDKGKNTFTYDSQGSILEIAGTERSLRFGYDSRNRQTKVSSSDGRSQENLYDAEGLRCGVKENGKLSRFAYHRGELLYERSEDREVSYHLGSGIEAARMGSELYYYHQDEQLSTALLTDAAGRIRNHYRYDAFGGMLAGEEGVSNRIRYTGQQYDEISGQYYLRARYYNPVVGRFLQEDVYEGDGLNLYAYCGNNPVRYYDPSGYVSIDTYESGKFGGDGGENERVVTNSAGEDVLRTYVRDQDELLRMAEEAAGGNLDSFIEKKPGWYLNEDETIKIEWNTEGHKNTNEGPHVTVRYRNQSDDGWHVVAKYFIEGWDNYKKTYK